MNREIKEVQDLLKSSASEFRNGEKIIKFNKQKKVERIIRFILRVIAFLSIIFLWKTSTCTVCGIVTMNTIIAFIGGMVIILLELWD